MVSEVGSFSLICIVKGPTVYIGWYSVKSAISGVSVATINFGLEKNESPTLSPAVW